MCGAQGEHRFGGRHVETERHAAQKPAIALRMQVAEQRGERFRRLTAVGAVSGECRSMGSFAGHENVFFRFGSFVALLLAGSALRPRLGSALSERTAGTSGRCSPFACPSAAVGRSARAAAGPDRTSDVRCAVAYGRETKILFFGVNFASPHHVPLNFKTL